LSQIPAVPAEIVVAILEAAYTTETTANDTKTLAACALVCKDWSIIAQRILFRRVSLGSRPELDGFMAAIDRSTPRGRALANTVESLHCAVDTKQSRGISQNAFAHAFLQCPNVSALSLAVYGEGVTHAKVSPSFFDDETLSLLQTGPRVTALRFDNWSENAYALSQLLEAFPCINSLSIAGTAPALCSPSDDSFPCALEKLEMNFHTSPSTEFVQWLLRNSTSTLKALDFKRSPAPQLLEDLLIQHSRTLESLSLPSCAASECVVALSHCARLRELRLENLWTALNAHLELPSTMAHLVFALCKDTALEPVIAAVRKSTTFESIIMHISEDAQDHAQLPNLRIACALQGVRLDVVSDVQTLRTIAL
jgi:hypothetical protein